MTAKQQPWDPKVKQIKNNSTKPKQQPKRKQATTTKLVLWSTDSLTVSPYDLQAFPFLSVSLRIFYIFPSILLLVFLFLFLLPAVLLSSSIFSLSILAFLWPKPCKDNNTNTNTVKQGVLLLFLFLWLFLCSLPKQQKQNSKTTKQQTILLLSLWSKTWERKKHTIRKGRQNKGRRQKKKKTKEE